MSDQPANVAAMPELTVFEPGDRFATLDQAGHVRLWTVDDDGDVATAYGATDADNDYPDPEDGE